MDGMKERPILSGGSWYETASVEYAPTQTLATLREVLGHRAQDPRAAGACLPALWAHGTPRSK